MTAPVGLFYGSDTGNTESVAKKIQAELGKNLVDLHDIRKAKKEDFVKTKGLDKDDPLKKEATGQYHAARSAHLGQSLQRKIGALDN